MLGQIYVRLRSLRRWRGREAELDEEIRFHLAEGVEERIAAGMSPEEAHAAARRDFGNVPLIRELTRETWGWGPAERLLQDLRGAFRMMRRNPTFTVVSAGTLALAIGVNVVMLSVLNTVLFRPLPYQSPEDLVMLWTETPSQDLRENRSAFWNINQWRRQSRSFTGLAMFDSVALTLTHAGETQRVRGARVSPNLLPLVGVQPRHGRGFSADEAAERRRVAVISHRSGSPVSAARSTCSARPSSSTGTPPGSSASCPTGSVSPALMPTSSSPTRCFRTGRRAAWSGGGTRGS